jgi:hypothetical protein
MPLQGLGEPVNAFLRNHIRNVDDLHLLVAVAANEDRWWDEESVARDLLIDRSHARSLLEHLAGHNLLEIRVTDQIRYQYRPGTPELAAAAGACLDAYHHNPVAVWRAVSHSPSRSSIRDFADAFRIRRRDDR